MKPIWIISTLLCACTGCQTSLEYDNTKRLTAPRVTQSSVSRASIHTERTEDDRGTGVDT